MINHHLPDFFAVILQDLPNYKEEMHQPPTNAGALPLQEYRRDVPPGWNPGDPGYPLRTYFEKLRLWYRVCSVEDELVGPLIAGRLYGRAAKIAMSLRVPRPDGTYDIGDSALVRLSVEEVRDPTTGVIIQQAIPSGVQYLTTALRAAFGQQDQDLATQSLDKFFGLVRGKMTLPEYSVEFETRLDEATDRAGLQLNDVGKFYLFFKHSGLPVKVVDDIKLQIGGDYQRFGEARQLALRLSPNRTDHDQADVFHTQSYYENEELYDEDYDYDGWYDFYQEDGDGWDYYQDENDGYWWYDDGGDQWQEWNDWNDCWAEDAAEQHPAEESTAATAEQQDATTEATEEFYGNKGKGGSFNDGCFTCGSKWHRAADCPMSSGGKGKGKGFPSSGKGYPSFGKSNYKGFGKRWNYGPKGKSKGKFKGKYRPKGKGKGKKGFGKWHGWTASRGGLNITEGIPDSSTRTSRSQEFSIATPPDAEVIAFGRTTASSSESEMTKQEDKTHVAAFNFVFNYHYQEMAEYFAVRGEKRRGLIIDPGAASGLIGSETLRDLIQHCVEPKGKKEELTIDRNKTSPVSGISGVSDQTLGEITVPLTSGGHKISFTGEVLGGEGSLCPALVGNPSLRKMNATIFANYFDGGDGLLVADSRGDDGDGQVKMFRLLLTDSGHYVLATDFDDATRVQEKTKKEITLFCSKVATESVRRWKDVSTRVKHCFLSSSATTSLRTQTEGDRGEHSDELHDRCEHLETKEGNDMETEEPKVKTVHFEIDEKETESEDIKDLIDNENGHRLDNKVSLEQDILSTQSSVQVLETPHDKMHNDNLDDHNNSTEIERPCGEKAILAAMTEEEFPPYREDLLPEGVDEQKLKKRYQAIPEEYYSKSGLRPITPSNFHRWFSCARKRGLKWHFWEVFSGSGRLSLTLLLAGLSVGFPVDMRYGWNVNDMSHQAMLTMARDEFCPGVMFMAPDCAPWSLSSSAKDPEIRHCERLRDKPALQWVQRSCEEQARHGRGYTVEQPLGSAMWNPTTESPLRLEKIPDHRNKQRCDQCMHDARDEHGAPVQKATALGANIKYKKTALRCSGHRGQQHAHLQGKASNGLNRTAMAAVYPRTMCNRMKSDMMDFLEQRGLLRIKTWPSDLVWFTHTHLYDCIRCQLGRACPRDIEHSLIPGQCRHGRWAPNTNPRQVAADAKKTPVELWKKEADKDVLDNIEIENKTEMELSIHNSHYLKKLLLETINNTLGIFSEASRRKINYEHWVDNATSMALFKEILSPLLQVQGVKVSLRPFNKSPPDPQVALSSGYLRLPIVGHVKEWTMGPIEDLREMSFNQINEAIDVDDWMVVVYGTDVGAVPAPSTPARRPRSIPGQPPLPPRGDDAALVPEVLERPKDPREEEVMEDKAYEEFDTQDREPLAPIKPNYNLRRVLERLPKLLEDGDETKAKRLLVGLHERLWHTPIMDFTNLLKRAGMPEEILKLAGEAVQGCVVCRKFVRLPNRPQMRSKGAVALNDEIQIDIFHWEGHRFLLVVDVATRYKAVTVIEGQESEQLLNSLFTVWIQTFGPPARVVMDQQMSLMGHETASEFERLNMERCPRGTTSGHGSEQHTGTGLVERHIQLLKLTMYKLRAELQRQGISHEPQELCQESCMAHNITLNYGGATPCMAVFGILPRGFYDPESAGVLSYTGAVETDVTPFERAIRIRQTALAQTHQSVIEDRIARANRTRPHQLNLGELIAGTSEVEFYREVQGDPGWRGPALLLRLDADEGVAVVQYQGKPYLISLRFLRPYRGIFHMTINKEEPEENLFKLMKVTESMVDYKIHFYGWLLKKTTKTWYKVPKENEFANRIMSWAEEVSKAMTKRTLHGIMMGKSMKTFKPPNNTTGTLVVWLNGGGSYSVQEHKNSNHLQMKKVSNYVREDMCMIYFYYYNMDYVEDTTENKLKKTIDGTPSKSSDDAKEMEVEQERKRAGPETRTVTLGPEKKKQKIVFVKAELEFLRHWYQETVHKNMVMLDFPMEWRQGYDLTLSTTRTFLLQKYELDKNNRPMLFTTDYKVTTMAMACLRTARIFKVDDETCNIADEDITPEMWPEIDAADLSEVKQFVDERAFKKLHKSQFTSDMVVVDARWVRKRKRYPDKSIKIKSRLCARGFLDQQKGELTTRSTTATRLSQRLLISTAARSKKRTVESIDIAGAFLKGFDCEQIQKTLKKMGVHSPTRTVVILPPLNVLRHLAALSKDFVIPDHQLTEYGLLCTKPVYGLNDAPLAWQLCLHGFIRETGGVPSHLDENTFTWKKDGALVAMATTHVDDIALTAEPKWMDAMHDTLLKKFKKVTRQTLPFDHCGCKYVRTADGFSMNQEEFVKKMQPAKIPDKPEDNKLTPQEVTEFRSILGALLWITATRLDVVADVSVLQSRVTVATIKDLKQANEVLEKVRKFKDLGLHYRYFEGEDLRVVCIHDASSASKGRNYAQEGLLVCLADDKFRHQHMDFETEYVDGNGFGGVDSHGGVMHVLHASGGKAKRVSYSTSHAETLSMVGGVEASTLVMIRLTEIDMASPQPTIKELIKIQEQGNPKLPMDFYGDCADVWQLVTGSKTLPQDKGQRLYILSIKECRICGKMRQMVLVPTECMTADSLTKPMVHDSMLLLLSTGKVKFYNVDNHPVKGRVLPALQDYDEHDIVKNDEEILQETKNGKTNLKICHSTVMLGYFAMKSFMPWKFVAAASLMTMAHAMEPML